MTGPTAGGRRAVVAVDWSGDVRAETGVHDKLWVAEVVDGELVALDPSSRAGSCARIVALAGRWGPELLAGLDVGFAYPSWFLAELGMADGPRLWAAAAAAADLPRAGPGPFPGARPFPDVTATPFFGWKGSSAPPPPRRFRACEVAARAAGYQPKSTFQVGGAGAVGTGTWRALPHLHRLSAAGLAVWPFDPATGAPVVAEVYPRMHTGPVVKSRFLAREARWGELVGGWGMTVGAGLVARALGSEDAFDAAVTALSLARAGPVPPPPTDPLARREGWILGLG